MTSEATGKTTGVELLHRAAEMLADQELPDNAQAAIGALSLAIVQIAKTSPGDQADQVQAIADMMRG